MIRVCYPINQIMQKWKIPEAHTKTKPSFLSMRTLKRSSNSNSSSSVRSPFPFSSSTSSSVLQHSHGFLHFILHYADQNPFRKVLQKGSEGRLRVQIPIRSLQSSSGGGCGVWWEASHSRDRCLGWSIRRQELSLRSPTWIPLQCPRSRNGDSQTLDPPNGPRSDCSRAPLPISGPLMLVFSLSS